VPSPTWLLVTLSRTLLLGLAFSSLLDAPIADDAASDGAVEFEGNAVAAA